jgi:hypothetical protein
MQTWKWYEDFPLSREWDRRMAVWSCLVIFAEVFFIEWCLARTAIYYYWGY